MKGLLIAIFLGICLNACSSQWYLQQAIKKDSAILQQGVVTEVVTDTLYVKVPGDKADTVVSEVKDTVVLEREKFRTVVAFDTIFKTLYVETECYPDTVEIIQEIPVQVIQPTVETESWWERVFDSVSRFILLAICLVVAGVWAYFYKNKENS